MRELRLPSRAHDFSLRPTASRRAVWVAVLVATALALLWLALPDTGTDLAAQQARADFARHHPWTPLDLRWYGGVQPAAYSVLTPYLAALVGVRLLSALAAVVAAGLIAELMVGARVRRPVLAAVWTAAACVANVVSGRTAFALGLVLGAGALLAMQREHRRTATALAVATTLASPVAGLFLGAIALCWATQQRAAMRLAFGAGVPLLILAAVVPEAGRMPVNWHSTWQAALASGIVAVLASRTLTRLSALLITLGTFVAFLVPNPVGSNAQRLTVLFAGAAVIAVASRPRVLLIAAVAWLAWWSVDIPQRDLQHRGEPSAERAAARELTQILRDLGPLTGRVEVVPLREHGESVEVSPLARGWLRQVDRERAALFYSGDLTAERYHQWLQDNAVSYVALADRPLDWSTARETGLLASPPDYLEQVHGDATWTVWRVRDGVPLVEGLVSQSPTTVVFDAAAGDTTVRVRWSRWLTVSTGCVRKDGDHAVVHLDRAARVRLGSSYSAPFTGRHC
jgi:hypothetical protein